MNGYRIYSTILLLATLVLVPSCASREGPLRESSLNACPASPTEAMPVDFSEGITADIPMKTTENKCIHVLVSKINVHGNVVCVVNVFDPWTNRVHPSRVRLNTPSAAGQEQDLIVDCDKGLSFERVAAEPAPPAPPPPSLGAPPPLPPTPVASIGPCQRPSAFLQHLIFKTANSQPLQLSPGTNCIGG
ncbi:MAG TPA: hypothetical protein VKQ27_07040 [Acetobacteraceae bacterium]|nr:hypothetical protein [Acetobacteraceae bacterium]